MICVKALDQIAPSPEHTNEAQWREQCQSNQKFCVWSLEFFLHLSTPQCTTPAAQTLGNLQLAA